VFLALYNGTAVGCHLVLTSGHYWISEYLGKTDDAIRGIQQLLYWEAIKAAYGSGARVFSFGRTFPTNKGLLVHKRRWGTIEEELAYSRVPLQAKTGIAENKEGKSHWTAHRVARLVTRIAPRFVLQRIGNFCYRHLG
jgi:hypothetical protein